MVLFSCIFTECGGEFNLAMYQYKTIQSPNYDPSNRKFYYDRTECNWLLRAPPGWHVVMQFVNAFGVRAQSQGECEHWVEVKYTSDMQHNGPRYLTCFSDIFRNRLHIFLIWLEKYIDQSIVLGFGHDLIFD